MSATIVRLMQSVIEGAREMSRKGELTTEMRFYFYGKIDAFAISASTEESFALMHAYQGEFMGKNISGGAAWLSSTACAYGR